MRIAIFDTDPSEQAMIVQALEKSGFDCNLYTDVAMFAEAGHAQPFDALIIDWQASANAGGAADGAASGAVLRHARAAATRTPVLLMVTGGREDDIIEGLCAGADDYLIKPLRPSELVARLQALLRRSNPNETLERYEFAPFSFHSDACEVSFALDGGEGKIVTRRVIMTQKEFDLGLLLFRNAGRPLSRNHIREVVWGGDADVSSRTMDTHVSRLRSKLELGPARGYRIMPVYGYGYRLDRVEA